MCHGQILGDVIRRARKPRRCGECGRTIEKGEKYRRYVWHMRGDPLEEQVQCAQCVGLLRAFFDDVADEACYFVGEVRSHISEFISGSAERARAVRAHVRKAMEEFK